MQLDCCVSASPIIAWLDSWNADNTDAQSDCCMQVRLMLCDRHGALPTRFFCATQEAPNSANVEDQDEMKWVCIINSFYESC